MIEATLLFTKNCQRILLRCTIRVLTLVLSFWSYTIFYLWPAKWEKDFQSEVCLQSQVQDRFRPAEKLGNQARGRCVPWSLHEGNFARARLKLSPPKSAYIDSQPQPMCIKLSCFRNISVQEYQILEHCHLQFFTNKNKTPAAHLRHTQISWTLSFVAHKCKP